jgi:hypothetical protein
MAKWSAHSSRRCLHSHRQPLRPLGIGTCEPRRAPKSSHSLICTGLRVPGIYHGLANRLAFQQNSAGYLAVTIGNAGFVMRTTGYNSSIK